MRRVAVAALILAACLCATVGAQQKTIRFKEISPRDLQLAEALRTRVSLEYDVPTELSEIISFLNEMIAQKVKIRNALRLDPKIVELNPRNVRITMENVRVERALLLLLTDATTADEEQANNELSYVHWSDAGVIYITNVQRLRRLSRQRKEFRFTDVRDLLARYPMGPGGSNRGDNDDGGNDDDDAFGGNGDDGNTTGGTAGRAHGMNELMRTIVRLTGRANWGDVGLDENNGDDDDDTNN